MAGARPAWGWVLGAALGAILVAAGLGFAAGTRQTLVEGRSRHLRAQLLMVAVAFALFTPALALGTVFGLPVRGYVFPIGVALVAGALIFGIGMQIAGACGSGTLAAAGTGSARFALTLVAMVVGAGLAAHRSDLWTGLPRLAPVGLVDTFGLAGGVALQGAGIGAVWIGLLALERRRRGAIEPLFRPSRPGNLPLGWGAVLIGLVSFATLLALGRPWSLSQPLALWGSWSVEALGLDDPTFWAFWEDPSRVDLYQRPFLADPSSAMNLGLVLGAMVASGLMLRFTPRWTIDPRQALGAILGGLLMGIGAVLATGCNIGAFLAGTASGSLHGWVWLLAAMAGGAIGVWLRPLFGLSRRG